jgi:hypothetical protein
VVRNRKHRNHLVAIDGTTSQIKGNEASNYEPVNAPLNQPSGAAEAFAKLRDRLWAGGEFTHQHHIERIVQASRKGRIPRAARPLDDDVSAPILFFASTKLAIGA